MEEKEWLLVHIPGYDELDAAATVDALAANIEPKLASVLIRELNDKLPLPGLGHVKRIRRVCKEEEGLKLSVLVCIRDNELGVRPELLQIIDKLSLETFDVKVPKYAASSRQEWEVQCQLWPTSFHPNCSRPLRLEFDEIETKRASRFMRMALHQASLAKQHGRLGNGAVVVDPVIGQVIASGQDESKPPSCSDCSVCNGKWHPLRHAAMVAIEKAAERDRLLFPDSSDEAEKKVAAKRQRINVETSNGCVAETIHVSRPYMCTGFDIYMVREPCAMCAMAMVHQRFRNVYYGLANSVHGALGGKLYLHRQKSLNHHYNVIRVSLDQEDVV